MNEQIKEKDFMNNEQDQGIQTDETLTEHGEHSENGASTNDASTDTQAALTAKIDELESRLIRAHADFENYKRRTAKEREELAKYASAKLIESLLNPFDNFERALQSSKEAKNFDSLIQGIEMVYRQLSEVLTKEGLEPIEAVGQMFNPEIHQAVMQVETDEYEPGIVVEELQKGYKFKDKVIRPSMVKVNA